MTATSAIPRVAASSSTAPERNATRSVPIVARRYSSLTAAIVRLDGAAVERAQRRQPADDVEEVGREREQRLPALARVPLGVTADQPHEDGDERQREQHIRPAVSGSITATKAMTATGTTVASTSCGRYRANVASSASTPATAAVATSALSAASSAAGRSRSRCSTTSSRSCERTSEAARRPTTSKLQEAAARPAAARTRSASGSASARGRACEPARGHVCEQRGLGEDEQRGDHAEGRIQASSIRTGRARRTSRGSSAFTTPSVCLAGSSTGPEGSWPPRRARKT